MNIKPNGLTNKNASAVLGMMILKTKYSERFESSKIDKENYSRIF